jgi:hypothetical protein
MRSADWASERAAFDDRGGATRVGGPGEDLRQRLGRLPPGHPSSAGYDELQSGRPSSAGYEELPSGLAGDEPEYAGLERPDDEPADRPSAEKPAAGPGRPRPGRPWAERQPGQPDAGPAWGAGGLAGRKEPYRPWFTAGESPEPWFTAEPGR